MRYDPADPAQARIDGPGAAAGATLVGAAFLVIGGACVLLGAGMIAAGVALGRAARGYPLLRPRA